MKKKLIAILLALATTLTACSGDDSPEPNVDDSNNNQAVVEDTLDQDENSENNLSEEETETDETSEEDISNDNQANNNSKEMDPHGLTFASPASVGETVNFTINDNEFEFTLTEFFVGEEALTVGEDAAIVPINPMDIDDAITLKYRVKNLNDSSSAYFDASRIFDTELNSQLFMSFGPYDIEQEKHSTYLEAGQEKEYIELLYLETHEYGMPRTANRNIKFATLNNGATYDLYPDLPLESIGLNETVTVSEYMDDDSFLEIYDVTAASVDIENDYFEELKDPNTIGYAHTKYGDKDIHVGKVTLDYKVKESSMSNLLTVQQLWVTPVPEPGVAEYDYNYMLNQPMEVSFASDDQIKVKEGFKTLTPGDTYTQTIYIIYGKDEPVTFWPEFLKMKHDRTKGFLIELGSVGN